MTMSQAGEGWARFSFPAVRGLSLHSSAADRLIIVTISGVQFCFDDVAKGISRC